MRLLYASDCCGFSLFGPQGRWHGGSKKLEMRFGILGVLAFSLLSLGVASASSLPCTIAGTALGAAVGSSTVVTCGGLTFDNFQVINATGGAAGIVDLTSISDGSACNSENEVCLSFNPNLQSGQDEAFLFTVTGSINQIAGRRGRRQYHGVGLHGPRSHVGPIARCMPRS